MTHLARKACECDQCVKVSYLPCYVVLSLWLKVFWTTLASYESLESLGCGFQTGVGYTAFDGGYWMLLHRLRFL